MKPSLPAASCPAPAEVSTSRRGFTLVELLVVIAVISVLASLLLPSLSMAKEKARSISCLNNLRQVGLAIQVYADDHQDFLVPAEYNVKNGARHEEGWPSLLVNGRYLPAPRSTNYQTVATGSSVFRCASGLPKVYEFNPVSRDDPEGAKAFAFTSEGTGSRFFIDSWYGINAGVGDSTKWPFTRVPLDTGQTRLNKMGSVAAFSSRMPAIFDGFWIHNGKDERINARHSRNRRTNLQFFDGSAAAFDTFKIPSVSDKQPAGPIQWRYPENP